VNGDVLCYMLVNRTDADDPHPESGSVTWPSTGVFPTRDEAAAAAALATTDVIVAAIVDRRDS
jgi:hypothetical protein